MTYWITGALTGLVWPWAVTACMHGHIRLNICSTFVPLWQVVALLETAAVLMVAAALTSPHRHVTFCVGCAIGGTASGVIAALIEWWQRRRPDKAAHEIGYKARKRIADLVQALRDSTQPRPIWQRRLAVRRDPAVGRSPGRRGRHRGDRRWPDLL